MKIKTAIRNFIAENFLFSANGYDLPDESSFLEEGVIDSTGTLELVMFVEEQFGIEVADNEIEPQNFDSVINLSNYVTAKLS